MDRFISKELEHQVVKEFCPDTPRGRAPVIRVSSSQEGISVIGAITIGRKDGRFGFHFHLLHFWDGD